MVPFWGYIVFFAVKKRIINGDPWQERKDTILRDTSGISPTDVILRELVSVETYDEVKQYHKVWVEEYFGDGNNRRDEKWTKSIAVGSKAFVESVKTLLGAIARERKVREAAAAYQLREPSALYGGHFEVKNDDIGLHNTYFWDIKPE